MEIGDVFVIDNLFKGKNRRTKEGNYYYTCKNPDKNTAGVRIAQIPLLARHSRQAGQHRLGDAAGAIAAAREPDRVQPRIVGIVHKGIGPAGVIAAEMAMLAETGRVKACGHRAVRKVGLKPGQNSLGARLVEARTGIDDADLHALPLASSLARASQAIGHSPVSPS